MDPAEEFDILRTEFGETNSMGVVDDADKLEFDEFVALPGEVVSELLHRVTSMKKKGRLSLLREKAKARQATQGTHYFL
jgi:hypothetical protein